MESTAQRDWEGDFCNAQVMRDKGSSGKQLSLWSSIYRLLAKLHLVQAEREEGKKGGDGILPRDLPLEALPAVLSGNTDQLTIPTASAPHPCYTTFPKETPCATAKTQAQHLGCHGFMSCWRTVFPRACSRSICSTALQVEQGGLEWGTNPSAPQTQPEP